MKKLSTFLVTSLAFVPSAFAQTPAPASTLAPAPAPAAEPAPAPVAEPATEPAPEPVEPMEPIPATEPEPVLVEPVAFAAAPPPPEVPPNGQHITDAWVIGGAAWDLSIPLGSTQDFVGNVSPSGFSLEARYIGLGRLSFGAFTGVHYMTAKDETTTVQGPITISGTQVRSIAATPWLARVHFSLLDVRTSAAQSRPVPYVAFGFGGARVLRTLDMGISGFSKESWHWAVSPEIGVQLPLNRAVFYLSSRFNYFASSGDGPEQMYLNVTLGASFF